ncbi:DUF4326 domain-containing protein [Nocardia wallacei]|uniref:DUF4326 domain-containing protein n=1 Tax=Nocardia wallacei TaxID=480035 RepID=UPI00245567E5|nr:DUF4326 domain-containing protein [Nocardia wallacei]
MPERIQLRRTAGWRKPEGAIVVARPSKWGNPFTMAALRAVEKELGMPPQPDHEARADLVEAFRSVVTLGPDSAYWNSGNFEAVLDICAGLDAGELRGHDLACWCPLDSPCHADVLLEIANAPEERSADA